MDDLTQDWYKSSYSGGSGSANRVEVADTSHAILVRDSQDRGGTVLAVPEDACRELLGRL